MNEYESFSYVYDSFMDDELYERWAVYLKRLFSRYGASPKIVLDLGCGGGRLTRLMADRGYDMIGVDLSQDMLSIAQSLEYNGNVPLFLNQDITELDLYGTVDAAYSVFDTINHLTGDGDLKKCFDRVSLFTVPGGLFVFDINSLDKFKNTLDSKAYTLDSDDYYCVWQSEFDEKTSLCRYDVTFFEYLQGNTYERYDEYFYEKYYSVENIKLQLENSGFELMNVFDGLTFRKPSKRSQRLVFAAVKK